MTEALRSTLSAEQATAILNEFVRSYAIGTSPRLDAVWLRAVAWQQSLSISGSGRPLPDLNALHPDALDPYPRHR